MFEVGLLAVLVGGLVFVYFKKEKKEPLDWSRWRFSLARIKFSFPKKSAKRVSHNLSDINYLEEGERLFREGRYEEAEGFYLKAVAEDADNPLGYGRLGVIYTHLGELNDAKEALERAVRLAPENGFYQNNLGLVLYQMGRYKEAVIYFENAVKLDEKNARRWANLGLAYQGMGEKERAKEAFQKALRLEPQNKKYQLYLQKLKEESL
jgi:Tfp pilus assembly protein PilF